MRKANVWIAMLLLVAVALLTGCGRRVEIPNACVGKIMTGDGLSEGLKPPSTFRLPWNFLGLRPSRLIIVEASDQQMKMPLDIFMPKDKLILKTDCRGTFSIANEEQYVNPIFKRIVPKEAGEDTYRIDFDEVYNIYASYIMETTIRAVLTQYSIAYVVANRATVSQELETKVRARLVGTPIKCNNLALSYLQQPKVITDAEQAAKARQVAVEKERADRLVKLTEANADLEVARRQQMIDLLQADTNRSVGLKLTRGVNPAFIQQRVLNIMDELKDNQIIIVPDAALANPAMMMAIDQELVKGLSNPADPNMAPNTAPVQPAVQQKK